MGLCQGGRTGCGEGNWALLASKLRPAVSWKAIALKFRLLSIQLRSEVFEADRKMSAIEIFRKLNTFVLFNGHDSPLIIGLGEPMVRFQKLIVFLAFALQASAQSQNPASAETSSNVPQNSIHQNAPCADQPRSLAELRASFRRGRLPLASQMTGTWVEIGDVWDDVSENSLNCSGIRRGSKFEFVLVADGYSVTPHAIGMMPPLNVRIRLDHQGSVEFPMNFGADEGSEANRCRLTNRGTLVCLVAAYRAEEFKKMEVQAREIYEWTPVN